MRADMINKTAIINPSVNVKGYFACYTGYHSANTTLKYHVVELSN
ncbi:hypothetical protein [Arsenophonus endosymbiont of Aleurodicus dispersus]|nr:hypothetical protein [Arsenophonus endosymbiont of Aleurodicus dispersus]